MGCRSVLILIAAIISFHGLITENGSEVLMSTGIFVAYGIIYFISYMINNSPGGELIMRRISSFIFAGILVIVLPFFG